MSSKTHDNEGHHLVLGELSDYITGNTIPDTHDERYRQKIARLLVDTLGYDKQAIEKSKKHLIAAGGKRAELKLDFLVALNKKACMLIRYAPGSIVSRRQCTLGWSRIVKPYQIPVVIITNGEDAEILDGFTGSVLKTGLSSIPSKKELEQIVSDSHFSDLSEKMKEMASRIVYAIEVDGSCSCDNDICRLDYPPEET